MFPLLCLVLFLAAPVPEPQSPPPPTDLDAFMKQVLARREVNRKMLDQYVLDETESFAILGPGRLPLWRTKREYTWYVRDAMHVRSPVKYEGVTVGEADRDRYEQNWIRREKSRQERRAKKEKEGQKEGQKDPDREKGEISIGPGGIQVDTGGAPVPTEPRFVSEAYFMDFKFEQGNYYLAGREKLEGQEVLKIEYYPTKLFDDDDKKTPREVRRDERTPEQKRRGEKIEEDIDRRMNKTALITLWVDPKEHQIVKYTFDNVWLDFLPGAWLVRVDELRASMTMGQPFPGVWLPRRIDIGAGLTLAVGSFDASYQRRFDQYREAATSYKIRVPKEGK